MSDKYWDPVSEEFVYDGCGYDSMRDLFLVGVLGFCGCVDDIACDKIIEALTCLSERKDREGFDALLDGPFNGDSAYAYITLQYLNDKGLTEHGISIRYPWLTDKGRKALEIAKLL